MGIKNQENFRYDIEHIDLRTIKSKRDLFLLLGKHDSSSFRYCVHTGLINVAIGKAYGMTERKELNLLYQCGLFHDVGKLGMSYEFLNYPDSYTMHMYNEMKNHTAGGGLLLKSCGAQQPIIDTALYHHCNFDGTGYPGGLYGVDIPFHARVTRIADSVDAYLSKRCYKEGGPANDALNDLLQFEGISYDPSLLKAYASVHERIMIECHSVGFDRPSQNMYIDRLCELFASDFEKPEREID